MLFCASHGSNVDLGRLNLYSFHLEEISCSSPVVFKGVGWTFFLLDKKILTVVAFGLFWVDQASFCFPTSPVFKVIFI